MPINTYLSRNRFFIKKYTILLFVWIITACGNTELKSQNDILKLKHEYNYNQVIQIYEQNIATAKVIASYEQRNIYMDDDFLLLIKYINDFNDIFKNITTKMNVSMKDKADILSIKYNIRKQQQILNNKYNQAKFYQI